MTAAFHPDRRRAGRLGIESSLEARISGAAEAENGHGQLCVAAVVNDVLRERLIPSISSADRVSTGIGCRVDSAVSRVDGSFVFQHVSKKPCLLHAGATLEEFLRHALHLMEGEPPEIRMVLIDLVAERSRL